jgi:DNA-binding Xre family transcriptional regulator
MEINYKKMWVLCAEREMNQADLRKRAGISPATFTKLRKNQEVSLSVLLKIAEVLECNIGDIADFVKIQDSE